MLAGEGEGQRGERLNARLRAVLANLPFASWEGSAWRMHAARYPAEDPGGSYRVSGRYHRGGDYFHRSEVFPALYLATAPEVCLGELQRHVTADMLPLLNSYLLTELRVGLEAVLDLTLPGKVGLEPTDLMHETDYSLTQALGASAREVGAEAILVPSATRLGSNLVVFTDRLRPNSVLEGISSRAPRLYVGE